MTIQDLAAAFRASEFFAAACDGFPVRQCIFAWLLAADETCDPETVLAVEAELEGRAA